MQGFKHFGWYFIDFYSFAISNIFRVYFTFKKYGSVSLLKLLCRGFGVEWYSPFIFMPFLIYIIITFTINTIILPYLYTIKNLGQTKQESNYNKIIEKYKKRIAKMNACSQMGLKAKYKDAVRQIFHWGKRALENGSHYGKGLHLIHNPPTSHWGRGILNRLSIDVWTWQQDWNLVNHCLMYPKTTQ